MDGETRPCAAEDFDAMLAVINAAATAYERVIPADRYHVPYMPADELRAEIAAGVRFWGWYEAASGSAAEEARCVGELRPPPCRRRRASLT